MKIQRYILAFIAAIAFQPPSAQAQFIDVPGGNGGSSSCSGDINAGCSQVTNGSHITNSSVPNSGLVNPATTVNSQTCTLGAACTVPAVTSVATGACLTGGTITTTGTIAGTYLIDARTSTSEAVSSSDACKLVTFSNGSAVAATIAQATGSFGAGWSATLQNKGAGTVTLTPATSTINGGSTLVIPQNTGCDVTSDGTNYQVSACTAIGASAGTVTSITCNGGLTGGAITTSGTCAVAANVKIRSFGASFGDTTGSALSGNPVVYFTVPYACTISAWNATVDAGTITFDIWKIASGTAVPTISNTITASALPAISTGTAKHSTTLTSWTTSVTANDIFGFQINTVATAKYAELDVECDQ